MYVWLLGLGEGRRYHQRVPLQAIQAIQAIGQHSYNRCKSIVYVYMYSMDSNIISQVLLKGFGVALVSLYLYSYYWL